MTAVDISVVHDHGGRIISISQFAAGVKAEVIAGDGQSVLTTTVDHQDVRELILTHKVDVARGALVKIADAAPETCRDRDALAAMLLRGQHRD
jgi:hypothetical protein